MEVVLGAIPIVLYALDNYERYMRPFKDYRKYELTLKTIRMNVFIQGEQLDITLNGIGLSKPTRQELEEHLLDLYSKAKCDEFMGIIDRIKSLLGRMMVSLDIDSSGKPKWTEAPPDRAEWEWRRVKRSFGRKERQKYIDELQYWNDSLKSVFEKAEIPSHESDHLAEKVQARYIPKECDKIRENVRCIHKALQSVNWTCHCPEHWGSIRLSWHMEKSITAGNLNFIFSSPQTLVTWQSTSIRVEENDEQESKHQATTLVVPPAVCHQPLRQPSPRRQRFKEILGVSRKPQDSTMTTNIAMTVAQSVHTPTSHEITCMCHFISNLAQAKQGILQLSDNAKRQIVIERVEDPHKQTDTVHLDSLLNPSVNAGRPRSLVLSRKQRFAIAAAATWAVLYLCGSPWLDSDWKGKDVLRLFLEESQNAGPPSLQANYPSISQLFKPGLQRPSTESAAAAQDFQNSQIRNRTLFNLGILLIELCLNKTLDQLRQELQANNFAASLGVAMPIPSDFEVANRLTEKV
ncbi:hypothetical protein FHETE_611 [Fusarium heterosporum]|uniref:DUF7580 domain-containing protein n=1 Tax=Fusarium heterosporum TaxID=42747 RepID=A0A8H5U2H0_FUSHE|nr:hypothetical protein FHETE_611 [Fusarium heterosporum]